MQKYKKPFIHIDFYLTCYVLFLFVFNSIVLLELKDKFELHILFIIMSLLTACIFILSNQLKNKFNYYFYKKSVKHKGVIPFTTYYYVDTGSVSFADKTNKLHNEEKPAVTDSLVGECFADTANEWWFNGVLLIKNDLNKDHNNIMLKIKILKEKYIISQKIKNFS